MMKALQSSLETVKNYYRLTKPGIIRGNILTALAGYLYAAKGQIDVPLLLTTLVGTTLVIASGCVFNNYIDRDIDSKMERTKKRALVVGTIQPAHALVFASIVGVVGFVVLVAFVNAITAIVGLIAFVSYVVVYAYAKRKTVHGTLVGSIPGALSLVAGYTAVTGQLDVTAANRPARDPIPRTANITKSTYHYHL
jgi:protoheme IX farnesyltransferase